MQSGRFSTPKSYPRGIRAETRNRAKDELKRVINAVERVRKWEQRWVLLKDSSIYVYRWVPVSGSTTSKPTTVQKTVALLSERANSNENSNDTLNNTPSNSQLDLNEEESNTAFYEGFESDSNQASNMVSDLSRHASGGNGSTDFSSLIKEEKDAKEKE